MSWCNMTCWSKTIVLDQGLQQYSLKFCTYVILFYQVLLLCDVWFFSFLKFFVMNETNFKLIRLWVSECGICCYRWLCYDSKISISWSMLILFILFEKACSCTMALDFSCSYIRKPYILPRHTSTWVHVDTPWIHSHNFSLQDIILEKKR